MPKGQSKEYERQTCPRCGGTVTVTTAVQRNGAGKVMHRAEIGRSCSSSGCSGA